MNFLVVSDREYKETSRGIDIITNFLSSKGNYVDHLVFFRRKLLPEKQISKNIRQLYFCDPIKFYRSKIQFLFPGFLLFIYFKFIIQKNTSLDFSKYNYLIIESGHPIYLGLNLDNKIIYRQSDPIEICFNSSRKLYRKMENKLIEKSQFVISALDSKYYDLIYKNKFYFWHSGFIPFERKQYPKTEKLFVILGGELDWSLINKIAKQYKNYHFNVIGIRGKIFIQKNISVCGYLDYENYKNLLLSAIAIIIPFSNSYIKKLKQVDFTAKIYLSIYLGIPILVKSYGSIRRTDFEKKLFIFNNNTEAQLIIDDIINNIESKLFNNNISNSTMDFLNPHLSSNCLKELEIIFKSILPE